MKYRILTMVGLLALSAGAFLQAQDYDDIYYDAAKSTKTTKVVKPAKTVAVYGEVPDTYKVAAQSNYRVERDEDEYNRRGAYDPSNASYEIDINGDTIYLNDSIYEEAFANTRRIERFYNPDIVILSDDDDLVELYYSETPTVNLIVGSDWGYASFWDSYYPWYTGYYYPWYHPYRPWYTYDFWGWGWGFSDFYYTRWYGPRLWGWNYWGPRPWSNWPHGYWAGWDGVRPHHNGGYVRPGQGGLNSGGHRVGLASNRNGRGRVDARGSNRNGISAHSPNGNRPSGVGTTTSRGSRGGYATGRGGGNMGSRGSSGVTTRSSGVSRTPSSGSSGRSYSGSSSSGSRSYSGGSRSYGGSSSSGGSRSSGGSYSGGGGGGGSHGGGGGGGSHGGSSGGGGHRR